MWLKCRKRWPLVNRWYYRTLLTLNVCLAIFIIMNYYRFYISYNVYFADMKTCLKVVSVMLDREKRSDECDHFMFSLESLTPPLTSSCRDARVLHHRRRSCQVCHHGDLHYICSTRSRKQWTGQRSTFSSSFQKRVDYVSALFSPKFDVRKTAGKSCVSWR